MLDFLAFMDDQTVPIPAETAAQMTVGAVIQVTGKHIPRALWRCWFRVEAKDEQGGVTLGRPFVDQALTLPFQWQGSGRGSALALERRSRSHRAA